MADLPITMSAPMVLALLREIEAPGTGKTMTRRVINLPKKTHSGGPIYEHPKMGGWAPSTVGGPGCYLDPAHTIPAPERACIWHQTTGTTVTTRYQPGDRLYVREHWRGHVEYDDLSPSEMGGEEPIIYLADGAAETWGWGKADPTKWGRHRQAMHMPRWASRITLLVTEVRVQRLQDISEADAVAEGIERKPDDPDYFRFYDGPRDVWTKLPRSAYVSLWNSLHGSDAWAANPWVCAVTFRPLAGNIDSGVAG